MGFNEETTEESAALTFEDWLIANGFGIAPESVRKALRAAYVEGSNYAIENEVRILHLERRQKTVFKKIIGYMMCMWNNGRKFEIPFDTIQKAGHFVFKVGFNPESKGLTVQIAEIASKMRVEQNALMTPESVENLSKDFDSVLAESRRLETERRQRAKDKVRDRICGTAETK